MSESGKRLPQKFQERRVSSIAIGSTFALAANWREVLRPYTPKAIAQRIGASPRTIDNWRDGDQRKRTCDGRSGDRVRQSGRARSG